MTPDAVAAYAAQCLIPPMPATYKADAATLVLTDPATGKRITFTK